MPPWSLGIAKPAQEIEDVTARNSDPYFDPKDTTLLAKADTTSSTAANASSELAAILNGQLTKSATTQTPNGQAPNAQDNDKLFALYQAVTRLQYIAQMATRKTTVDGQLPGLDTSFQNGLSQVLSFVQSTSFNGLSVLPGQKTSSTQSAVTIPYAPFSYAGGTVASDKAVLQPVAGVSASDSFTISVTKGGVKSDVAIDLANVSGPLTLDNIDSYVNQQLSASGFGTRFARVQTGGSLEDGTATWGVQVNTLPGETLSLSSAAATPAVYIAATTGTPADQQGKVLKLTNLDGTPDSEYSKNIAPDTLRVLAPARVLAPVPLRPRPAPSTPTAMSMSSATPRAVSAPR